MCPDNDLGFTGNTLSMLFRMAEPRCEPNPVLERALEVLFVLHADHEQNCSAHVMRSRQGGERPAYVERVGEDERGYVLVESRVRRELVAV